MPENAQFGSLIQELSKIEYVNITLDDVRKCRLADLYDKKYLPCNRKRSPVAKDFDDVDRKDLKVLLHLERKEESQMKEEVDQVLGVRDREGECRSG